MISAHIDSVRGKPANANYRPGFFFLLKKCKKYPRQEDFESSEELKEAVEEYFVALPKKRFLLRSLDSWEKRICV